MILRALVFVLPLGTAAFEEAVYTRSKQADRHIYNRQAFGITQDPLSPSEHGVRLTASSSVCNQHDVASSASNYSNILCALEVMQSHFFSVAQGVWPRAIDWTSAVISTQVSATLAAISNPNVDDSMANEEISSALGHENLINRYFTQIISYFHGENDFSLRQQAYDDMLWVVLGWLESTKFIDTRSVLKHSLLEPGPDYDVPQWYARQFIPQFAHRARVFYDLASKGWDATLCGGGMVWSPYLTPYKNAITNQLWITASISMYMFFPGDRNTSPFLVDQSGTGDMPPARAHDERYLDNAIEGYWWLKHSGMRNSQGLYADGFHVTGWRRGSNPSNGTRQCDLREETVYTYNQGVLLSGLRWLWEATGLQEYLEDGHELIRNVIAATGWEARDGPSRYQWAGLGRDGILEEACDWGGRCTQNGQTFKGIFFHHFSVFCDPLPEQRDHTNRPWLGDEALRALHRQSCQGYAEWVTRNAEAAAVTRDRSGEFGEWWGRSARRRQADGGDLDQLERPSKDGTDYRNEGIPHNDRWQLSEDALLFNGERRQNDVLNARWQSFSAADKPEREKDINDRGRGRTVETQSGGLAVVRAAWKLSHADSNRS